MAEVGEGGETSPGRFGRLWREEGREGECLSYGRNSGEGEP